MIPFLENVTRGRNVPRERLEEVAHHYELFGGVSPINAQNRALIAALRVELDDHGIDLPIYFGNRNWHPFLADALREMADDGVERALAFFTSAYSSYSGCRQYREDLFRAQQDGRAARTRGAARRACSSTTPGGSRRTPTTCATALAGALGGRRRRTWPSRPTRSRSRWRRPAATRISCASRAGSSRRRSASATAALVYQSRSGPPHVPWLEPDILDHLEAVAARGVDGRRRSRRSGSSPIISRCSSTSTSRRARRPRSSGLNLVRASSASTHPAFVRMIRELIEERLGAARRAARRSVASPRATTSARSIAASPGPAGRAPGPRREPGRQAEACRRG